MPSSVPSGYSILSCPSVKGAMNHYKSNILGCLREFGLLLPPVIDQQFYWIRRRHGADYRRLFSWPLLNLCGKRISVFADASHPNYSVEDTWAWGEPSDFDKHFEIEYSDDLGSPADWYYRFFGYRCMIRWNVLATWLHNHAWGWELVPAEIVHMMLEVDWPLSKFYGWHHDYQYFPNGPPDPTNPYFTPSDNVNFHDVAEEVPESRIRKITGPGPTATEVVDRAERVQHDALMEEGKCAICYRQFFEGMLSALLLAGQRH